MPTVATVFPSSKHKSLLLPLIADHQKIPDERLLLAIYYASERDPQDLFLFEVIENFGGNGIDDEQELMEVTYASTPDFSLEGNQSLHMVLTSSCFRN